MILEDYDGNNYTMTDVKKILIDEYKKLEKYNKLVFNILTSEGKTNFIKQILSNEITIVDYITSDNYYITNLDILVLSNRFKIPIVLLSSTSFKETETNIIVTNKDSDNFYFIKAPADVKGTIDPVSNKNLQYRMVVDGENNSRFIKDRLNGNLIEKINTQSAFSLVKYIETYSPDKRVKKVKKLGKLVLK